MAYVYRHIRLDKNIPFYIGIGNDNKGYYTRAFHTGNNRKSSSIWNRIVAKTDYEVEIMIDNITWDEACKKEKEFIAMYGRKNKGTGTLANMTDGGEGSTGKVISAEVRYKFGNANRGKKMSIESSIKKSLRLKGQKRSLETKIKLSNAKKGTIISEKQKIHLSKINRGKKLSKETIEKIKLTKGNRTYHYIGRKKSEEEKKKIGIANIGNKYCLGFKHTAESCHNMKISCKHKKAVLQFDFSGNLINEYDSQREAQKKTGIPKESIGRACKGGRRYKNNKCKGYIWKYKNEIK